MHVLLCCPVTLGYLGMAVPDTRDHFQLRITGPHDVQDSQLLLGIVLGHLWRQGCKFTKTPGGRAGVVDHFQKDSFQAE